MANRGVVWAPGMDLMLRSRVGALAEARGYRLQDTPTPPPGTRIALIPFAEVGRRECGAVPVLAYGHHTDRMGQVAARVAGARWIVAHRTLGESLAQALDDLAAQAGSPGPDPVSANPGRKEPM